MVLTASESLLHASVESRCNPKPHTEPMSQTFRLLQAKTATQANPDNESPEFRLSAAHNGRQK